MAAVGGDCSVNTGGGRVVTNSSTLTLAHCLPHLDILISYHGTVICSGPHPVMFSRSFLTTSSQKSKQHHSQNRIRETEMITRNLDNSLYSLYRE